MPVPGKKTRVVYEDNLTGPYLEFDAPVPESAPGAKDGTPANEASAMLIAGIRRALSSGKWLADQLGGGTVTSYARAYASVGVNSPTSSTPFLFDTITHNGAGAMVNANGATTYTVPAGQAGLYAVGVGVRWDAPVSGDDLLVDLVVNGTTRKNLQAMRYGQAVRYAATFTVEEPMADGAAIRAHIYSNNVRPIFGGAQPITFFTVRRIGGL